jgi:hypothetical protein
MPGLGEKGGQVITLVEQIAQFIAVCSASIRVETLGYAASFSSPWREKRRVLVWRKPLLTEQLQPSTNADTLREVDNTCVAVMPPPHPFGDAYASGATESLP